jgi:ligand-binding sensor domain-containing protein/signal transduction histidine kinase
METFNSISPTDFNWLAVLSALQCSLVTLLYHIIYQPDRYMPRSSGKPLRLSIFIFFCLFIQGIGIFAQPSFDLPRDLHQYHIQQWGLDDGLPQLTVGSILRSKEGYLWVGTQKGLARFDGITFESFYEKDIPELSDGYICDLFECSNGSIWIATRSGGLVRYRDRNFDAITSNDGLASNFITSIEQDDEGRLWLGTAAGASVLWSNQVANYSEKDGLPNTGVTDIAITGGTAIWAGTKEGLRTFDEGRFRTPDNMPEPYRYLPVNHLYVDGQEQLWVLLNQGLLVYRNRSWEVVQSHESNSNWDFNTLAVDHRQQLWLGTSVNSLVQLQDDKLKRMAFAETLVGRRIHAMTTDVEQNIWLGTSFGLIQIRDPKSFAINENQGLSYNMVTPILVDRKRKGIWIGTHGGGLNFYSNGQVFHQKFSSNLNDQSVLSLALDQKNQLWIGTRSGLSVQSDTGTRHYTAEDGLTSDFVRALTFDHENTLWVGTRDGLFKLKDGTFSHPETLRNTFVRSLYHDRENRIWIGTNDGLYQYQPETESYRLFNQSQGLASNFVRSIYQDIKGNFWVGTYGGGLHIKQGEQFIPLREDDGLYSNIVFDIREDTSENLWFSAQKGVQKLPIQHFKEYLAGQRPKLEPELFRLRTPEGNFAECNGGFYPAGASLPDGSLLYPTTGGVQVIPPDLAAIDLYHPAVKFTSIMVDGSSLAQPEAFEVDGKAEKVEFHFTALSLKQAEEIQFKVKLEGFDRDWEHIDHRRYHYYTSLPPGQYTFRVMATNADGIWSDQSAVISFVWKPTLYETTWFWLLCAALILILMVLAFQWRMLHLRKREKRLQELVETRTAALQEANLELKQAQERLIRSAHFAGMAEIATNVLHTVGNELNSVYVSVSLIEQKTKKLRVHFPKTVAHLLEKHRDQFPEFLDEDPKGQKLITTLEGMTDILKSHQKAVYGELDALTNKITNINNVVRTLPEHAEVGSFAEKVALVDLIEEALSIQKLSLKEHQIHLVCEYNFKPILRVQKSKFIQVLVNLIKNSWEAALETQENEPIVQIKTQLGEGDRVVLSISDNGSGIDPSDQKRIFNQGYTTKAKGNGFGLHFCGNVVAELKGHISVESEGRHKGATFLLDLPTVP